MLDLEHLQKLHIGRKPWGQLTVANLGLSWDYRLPRRTRIELVDDHHLPSDRPVMLAMNHTDSYNYWPFQYQLYRNRNQFCCAWVKGKYYESALMGWFMDKCDNIPLPSRGYVLTTEFRKAVGRAPDEAEYRALRDLVDADGVVEPPPEVRRFLARKGGTEAFVSDFEALWSAMAHEVERLSREAVGHGHHLLVFPQGTRSKRLPRGHGGMMQVVQRLGLDVVPIGCNGSDKVYPSRKPFARGGHIVYRFGAPLRLEGPELGPHRVTAEFTPFTPGAHEHRAAFQAATDVIMDRINLLLDPEYQYAPDGESDGVSGVNRFV